MFKMKKIYTKHGDRGITCIREGVCLPKDDIRIEANGTLDELNAFIGLIRSELPKEHAWHALLLKIQRELLAIMSHVATPPGASNSKPLNATHLTAEMEQAMDKQIAATPLPPGFTVPGSSVINAHFHLARTVARRAERRLCALHRQSPVEEEIMCFVNRLSDLLYVMALCLTKEVCGRNLGEEERIIQAE